MDFLRIRLLRTGLVFFGILLVIYSFSNEKGDSSASNHPKGPVIVRNKVSHVCAYFLRNRSVFFTEKNLAFFLPFEIFLRD
jgi:hypothetical protein